MVKLFIFTWNTQTIRYKEDQTPDFVEALAKKILKEKYDLVVLGLQEDSIRDSPLLAGEQNHFSTALVGYELLEVVSLSGWGVTTYKALRDDWEYRPRGLRLAVYKKENAEINIIDVETRQMPCLGIKNWLTAGKGGVTVNLKTSVGDISFLNVHLPFNSQSLNSPQERYTEMLWQARCLQHLYTDATETFNPDYLFLLGDLNFRVQFRGESTAKEITERLFSEEGYLESLVREADELQLLLDYSRNSEDLSLVPPLNEGLNNGGPLFLPTCKLQQGRENEKCVIEDYRAGNNNRRTPSWCDRILYTGRRGVLCLVYNRWDYGEMNLSDHASVIGVYQINN